MPWGIDSFQMLTSWVPVHLFLHFVFDCTKRNFLFCFLSQSKLTSCFSVLFFFLKRLNKKTQLLKSCCHYFWVVFFFSTRNQFRSIINIKQRSKKKKELELNEEGEKDKQRGIKEEKQSKQNEISLYSFDVFEIQINGLIYCSFSFRSNNYSNVVIILFANIICCFFFLLFIYFLFEETQNNKDNNNKK
ncbi:hypothetical protein RFI_12183 [Reticulomyxa filosa]|uniref:Transmembrane protein n=1 Tax=Reticulomyxa filosa TaxID=46433 RepID=X6NGX7_RETFI|nr:hypothetical protein RFI_12183 [Reticulomyxa filosa]|eukprot:ETO24964.1 hypothetical protein RFI_12183 [Reticulomyxa filosa]